MNRKIILFTMPLFIASILQAQNTNGAPQSPRPFRDITATQLVSEIMIGWNLGNSLETAPLTGTSHHWATTGEWRKLPANPTVTQMETEWYCPLTTKATITALKNAGFNAIRIPVSWLKAADSAMDYLQVILVDIIESTGWKWNELSSYVKMKENIAANTVISGSITIIATKTATNTSHRANKLVFQAGKGTVNAPLLTFTKFEIKKL